MSRVEDLATLAGVPKLRALAYHSMANPVKGEPVRERGLPNPGYRPGRKSARRQDKRRKRGDDRSR